MSSTYKIVVMSDTHGDLWAPDRVIEEELPFDYLIHLGDAEASLNVVLGHADAYELIAVRGNCDWFSTLPDVVTKKIGYYNLMCVHGHTYAVRSGHRILLDAARREYADVVLYGHTHVPCIERDPGSGILIVNPGSLTQNRPRGRKGTYAVLTISDDALPQAELKELD